MEEDLFGNKWRKEVCEYFTKEQLADNWAFWHKKYWELFKYQLDKQEQNRNIPKAYKIVNELLND